LTEHPEVDWVRITECLDRHGVEYLIVGGLGAQLHGATRPTGDFDSLPKTTGENLDRLAAAMRELHAFLRVEGLSDEESRALPTRLDAVSLGRMDISTWRTDAGDLDVLTAIPTRDGGRARYEELVERAKPLDFGGVPVMVAALGDIIASKEWADRPKDREALPELRDLIARESS
jgi:hypothetical protein